MSKGYTDAFPASSRSSAHPQERSALYESLGPDLAGQKILEMPKADKLALFQKILKNKVHGLSFSPYIAGQKPGDEISDQQIEQRLEIIRPYTSWIRTFSCSDDIEKIPRIAHQHGLKVMVGVGIGEDKEKNEAELQKGIEIAKAGHADILAVGNEVLLRGDLNEDELIDYIERAKAEVTDIPVGYVDAYFLFENHPRMTAACDVLLINCYPFWESCPAEHSLLYMKEMYRKAAAVSGGKKVIISETGWPNKGTPYGGAVPSEEHALNYFLNTYLWAEEDNIDVFYFSSFDESWKVGDEGDVGAYWGIWDEDGKLKYV